MSIAIAPTAWDIAEAVAVELHHADFVPPLTIASEDISAEIVPTFEESDPATIEVTVIPTTLGTSVATRKEFEDRPVIDIGIQKRIVGTGDAEKTEFRNLLRLVNYIKQYIAKRPLASLPDAQWITLEHPILWLPEMLRTKHVFTSVIRCTYITSAEFGG